MAHYHLRIKNLHKIKLKYSHVCVTFVCVAFSWNIKKFLNFSVSLGYKSVIKRKLQIHLKIEQMNSDSLLLNNSKILGDQVVHFMENLNKPITFEVLQCAQEFRAQSRLDPDGCADCLLCNSRQSDEHFSCLFER